jgi:hypothetical protein
MTPELRMFSCGSTPNGADFSCLPVETKNTSRVAAWRVDRRAAWEADERLGNHEFKKGDLLHEESSLAARIEASSRADSRKLE